MYDFMNYNFFKGIGGGGGYNTKHIMPEPICKCLLLYDFLFFEYISIATLTATNDRSNQGGLFNLLGPIFAAIYMHVDSWLVQCWSDVAHNGQY